MDTKYQFSNELLRIKTCAIDTFITRSKCQLIWSLNSLTLSRESVYVYLKSNNNKNKVTMDPRYKTK